MTPIDTLLYYPTVAVPKEWAKTALFNGYSIGSITPRNWYESYLIKSGLDPSMNEVRAQGTPDYYLNITEIEEVSNSQLFKKIDPSNTIYINRKLNNDFFSTIQSEAFLELLKSTKVPFSDIPEEEIHHQSWIHEDKISIEIIDFLRKNGWAAKDMKKDGGLDFYIVDNNVAAIYISLLSQNIADKNSYMIPSSESINIWRNISNPDYLSKKEACINILLNNCILSPAPDTSIESILNFRDEHKVECQKYQEKLFEMIKGVSKNSDSMEVKKIMEDEIKVIQYDLVDLERNLEDLKIRCNRNTVFLSIPVLVGMALGTFEAVRTGNISNTYPFELAGDGLLGTISGYFNYGEKCRQKRSDSPATYLFLAKSEGISKMAH